MSSNNYNVSGGSGRNQGSPFYNENEMSGGHQQMIGGMHFN